LDLYRLEEADSKQLHQLTRSINNKFDALLCRASLSTTGKSQANALSVYTAVTTGNSEEDAEQVNRLKNNQ